VKRKEKGGDEERWPIQWQCKQRTDRRSREGSRGGDRGGPTVLGGYKDCESEDPRARKMDKAQKMFAQLGPLERIWK